MNVIFIIFRCNSISFEIIINKILTGIFNPSVNYNDKFVNLNNRLYNFYAPIYTLTSVITYSIIPLSLYYFDKIDRKSKILACINIVVELSRWFVIGTNKGIIDILIILFSVILLKRFQSDKKIIKKDSLNIKKIFFKFTIIIFLCLGILYFLNNINGRLEGRNSSILLSLHRTSLKRNSIYKELPEGLYSLVIYMQSYLTQGYYGLEISLDNDFESMYGIGCSSFLTENLKDVVGDEFVKRSYIEKASRNGWSSTVNWHTAYTWIANDISFVGVFVFMFGLGIYFAKIVIYSINKVNWIFVPLFSSIFIMFFYFPMNNQLFNNPFQFMGFVGLNILWILITLKKKE